MHIFQKRRRINLSNMSITSNTNSAANASAAGNTASRSSSVSSAASPTSAAPPAALKKKFPCAFPGCGKSFSRSEHLHRHALNHQDGNNTCQRCSAHFRRRDLLGMLLSCVFGKVDIQQCTLSYTAHLIEEAHVEVIMR